MIGEYDKKLYLWADDGGEKVQICIALTCPKVYRGVEETTGLMTFDEPSAAPAAPKPAQITPEENKTLEDLMKKFGI